MEVVKPYEVNTPDAPHKILLATQGSPFKKALTQALIESFEEENYYIQVIDVTQLDAYDANDWSAVILIHTWEYFKPNPEAKTFVQNTSDKNKLLVVTTSGSGDEMIKGIDGISSASQLTEIDDLVAIILFRLHKIIQQ